MHYVVTCIDVVDKSSYALSVRDYNEMTREVTIKHYRIRKLDRGGVFISPKKTFSDLLQLVDHYHSKFIYTLDHFTFWISLSLSGIATYTHRPQGVIIVGIYVSSDIYCYYYYTKPERSYADE